MFHPGVWIKNFATAAIARDAKAFALNLIVDNDIPKNASLRVPVCRDGGCGSSVVEFDDWAGEIPYEDWVVKREDTFASFGQRVLDEQGGLVPDPLIHETWPLAIKAAQITDRVGLRLATARRGIESMWGVENAEVPLGKVCGTEAFHWFASHLLANLPRFRSVHNAALGRYRALYGIRSKNHPVPALAREGDWIEAPFWVWRQSEPRRRPLMARQNGRNLDLRIAGESDLLSSLRPRRAAPAQLWPHRGRRARRRPRQVWTSSSQGFVLFVLFSKKTAKARSAEACAVPIVGVCVAAQGGLEEVPAVGGRGRAADGDVQSALQAPRHHAVTEANSDGPTCMSVLTACPFRRQQRLDRDRALQPEPRLRNCLLCVYVYSN